MSATYADHSTQSKLQFRQPESVILAGGLLTTEPEVLAEDYSLSSELNTFWGPLYVDRDTAMHLSENSYAQSALTTTSTSRHSCSPQTICIRLLQERRALAQRWILRNNRPGLHENSGPSAVSRYHHGGTSTDSWRLLHRRAFIRRLLRARSRTRRATGGMAGETPTEYGIAETSTITAPPSIHPAASPFPKISICSAHNVGAKNRDTPLLNNDAGQTSGQEAPSPQKHQELSDNAVLQPYNS